MNEFTPGPWEYEEVQLRSDRSAYGVVKNEKGSVLFDTINSDVSVIHEEDGVRWDEQGKHNLTLAAAAPDLLAACEAALRLEPSLSEDAFYSSGECAGILRTIRAALAKARGES